MISELRLVIRTVMASALRKTTGDYGIQLSQVLLKDVLYQGRVQYRDGRADGRRLDSVQQQRFKLAYAELPMKFVFSVE